MKYFYCGIQATWLYRLTQEIHPSSWCDSHIKIFLGEDIYIIVHLFIVPILNSYMHTSTDRKNTIQLQQPNVFMSLTERF